VVCVYILGVDYYVNPYPGTSWLSNITRQAQRRTLDDQLNTQAFYAAESGINDAKPHFRLTQAIARQLVQVRTLPIVLPTPLIPL